MGRSRVLAPDTVRIGLADFHKRAHDTLITVGKKRTVDGKDIVLKATPEDIAASEAVVAQAVIDGEWIEVKKRITYGEKKTAQTSAINDFRDGRIIPNFKVLEISQAVAYLVDWSHTDPSGKRIPIDTDAQKLSALDSFDDDSVQEIVDAVAEHIEAMEAAAKERKNGQGGAKESSPISPSVAI